MKFKRNDCNSCKSVDTKLFLKGSRCFTNKCPIEKKLGETQFGSKQRRVSVSLFKRQLHEKRKAQVIYGINNNQLKSYIRLSTSADISSDKYLVYLLESRLDNVLYRAGFTSTRNSARLKIAHRKVTLNDKVHDIPSSHVKSGDRIVLHGDKDQVFDYMKNIPSWITIESESTILINGVIQSDVLFDANSVIEFR